MKGKDETDVSQKDKRLVINIRQSSLGAFWIRETRRVRDNLTILRKMGTMDREELGLEDWFSPLGHYILKDEVRMGVVSMLH